MQTRSRLNDTVIERSSGARRREAEAVYIERFIDTRERQLGYLFQPPLLFFSFLCDYPKRLFFHRLGLLKMILGG